MVNIDYIMDLLDWNNPESIHDVKYYSDAANPGLIVYEHSRNYQREAVLSAAVAMIAIGVIAVGSTVCPPVLAALPLIPVL